MGKVQSYSHGQVKQFLREGISSTRKLPLGYYFDDGNVRYRYAHIAASGVQARGYGQNEMSGISIGASAYFECNTTTNHTGFQSGDMFLALHSASDDLPSQAFIGGKMAVVCGTGSPFTYGIKDYEVVTNDSTVRIWLNEPIASGIDSGTNLRFLFNPYWSLTKWSAASNDSGFAPRGILYMGDTCGSNTSGYGFLITRGQTVAYQLESASAGQAFYVGSGAGGINKCTSNTCSGALAIGYEMMSGTAVGDHTTVELFLDPF